MIPADFEQANFTFTKPKDWSDEQCSDLRVWRGNVKVDETTEMPTIISKWQPSKEDIEAINNGEPIWLYITGSSMPPVLLSTEMPFVSEQQITNQ